MAKTKKYYVVWKGHRPGVYDSWAACNQQIIGYKGAQYKSFKTYAEAMSAYEHPELVKMGGKPKKQKYYVVWRGHQPGVYSDWEKARKQLTGAAQPLYKTFGSKELAEKAFIEGPTAYEGKDFKKTRDLTEAEKQRIGTPIPLSLAVDAACSGKTNLAEYQGVITETGTQVFHVGPLQKATNNIGEFLALVHALAYLKKNNIKMPIYSDSRIAMGWVKKKRVNTSSEDPHTQQLIQRGLKWLHENSWDVPILKWETKAWGEIPADFGRK